MACKHENLIGFWTVLVSGSVNDAGEVVELETDEGGCYQQALESDGPDEVQCRDCGAVVSRKPHPEATDGPTCPGHGDDVDCEIDPFNPCQACRERGDREDR